jgi:hypothetical protein
LPKCNFVPPDFCLASAEIFMLAMACVILIVDLFVKDKQAHRDLRADAADPGRRGRGHVPTSTGRSSYTFSNMFVGDLMGDLLKLLVYLTVIVVCSTRAAISSSAPQMAKGEYYALALFATLGMMVMISANHFLTVYIGLELLSLVALCDGGDESRFGAGHRGGDEVLRARRAGFRPAALRHVDDLRRDRHAGNHGHRRAPLHGAGQQDRSGLSAWSSWFRRHLPSSSAWFPSTCGFPTSITARRPR